MERQLADVQAPIQALADELHRRLDALLTDNQRAPERDAKPNRYASRPAEIAP
jgi:hypothetical protein